MKALSEQSLISILLFLGIVFVTFGNYLAYKKVQSLLYVNHMVYHTYKVIETAETASFNFVNTRSSIVSHILKGKSMDLPGLREKMKGVSEKIKLLDNLTFDNPRQKQRVGQLKTLLEQNINIFLTITKELNNQTDKMKYLVSNPSFYLREAIISKFNEVINEERTLLDARKIVVNKDIKSTNLFFFSAIILSEALLALSYILLYYHLKRREEAEKKVTESEAQLRLILDNAKDYAIFMLDNNGAIRTWSKSAEKVIGYKSKEIVNKHFSLFYPKTPNHHHELLKKLKLAREQGNFEEECWLLKKSGSSYWANSIITTLHDNSGRILGFSQIIRDLTERLNNEKLKNEFISVVSHELRTPLTSIFGSLNLILGEESRTFSEKVQQLLSVAYRNCERLLLLVNDILDVNKIESNKIKFNFQICEINHLVLDCVKANEMFGKRFRVTINFKPLPQEYYVKVDVERFMQVMANLISNAIKFSGISKSIDIGLKIKKDKIQIAVCDQGIGIPKSFQKRIFQKFAQADSSITRNYSGSGLGLNISKSLIEKMGGDLKFKSNKKQGTIFYFELLIHQGQNKKYIIEF